MSFISSFINLVIVLFVFYWGSTFQVFCNLKDSNLAVPGFLGPLLNYLYENVSVSFFIVDLVPEQLEEYLCILFCTHTLSEGYGFWLTFAFCYSTLAVLLTLVGNFIFTLYSYTNTATILLFTLLFQVYFFIPLPDMSLEDETAVSLVTYFFFLLLCNLVVFICWMLWQFFRLGFTTPNRAAISLVLIVLLITFLYLYL